MGMNVRLARKWASVPGVHFPKQVQKILDDNRCITFIPPADGWISAPALAKHLGVSADRANVIGMRNDEGFRVYVDPINPSVRTRYFRRAKVMDAEVKRSVLVDDYKDTHMTNKEAMDYLNVSRNAVSKMVLSGKLNPVRVRGGGKRGIYYMYSKKELEQIKTELAQDNYERVYESTIA